MARPPSPALTDAELRIMRALWGARRATVADLSERLEASGPDAPAYNTVLTILGILERKGYVHHQKDGRAFIFEPLIDESAARRRALSHLLARFFDNSRELLVMDLFGHETLDAGEVAHLRELIDAHAPASRKPSRKHKEKKAR
jgi:predicted transcriptional regulator